MLETKNVIRSIVILIAMIVFAPTMSQARTLHCYVNAGNGGEGGVSADFDHGLGTHDKIIGLQCREEENGLITPASISIAGRGLSFRANAATAFRVMCLGSSELTGTYYGVTAQAAVVIGLSAGQFISSEGRPCVLTGLSGMSIGASLLGAKMVIQTSPRNRYCYGGYPRKGPGRCGKPDCVITADRSRITIAGTEVFRAKSRDQNSADLELLDKAEKLGQAGLCRDTQFAD